jgi:hypothetical protein
VATPTSRQINTGSAEIMSDAMLSGPGAWVIISAAAIIMWRHCSCAGSKLQILYVTLRVGYDYSPSTFASVLEVKYFLFATVTKYIPRQNRRKALANKCEITISNQTLFK